MPKKPDDTYQHADIILDTMIKESGLSQAKFAKRYLGISGASISGARKNKKIPSRWFEIVEEKLGLSKEELCTFAADGEHEAQSRGLTLERHREIGMELFTIHHRLQSLSVEFGMAYPRTGSLSQPETHLHEATTALMRARDRAEENLYKDFRSETSKDRDYLKYYYPGGDLPQEDLYLYLAKTAKNIAELIEVTDRAAKKENYKKIETKQTGTDN